MLSRVTTCQSPPLFYWASVMSKSRTSHLRVSIETDNSQSSALEDSSLRQDPKDYSRMSRVMKAYG